MAALSKSIIGAGATLASLVAALANDGVRSFVSKWLGLEAPGGGWRLLCVVFALANLKSLPFMWHFRFLNGFLYHLYLQPTPIPAHALFQPSITSTRCSLLEMDYNLHKSNSTYFADMDISRTHLFTAIIRNGIVKSKNPASGLGASQGTKKRHMIALGGISCMFKREIKPYQKYEMWTRVLSWDRKWFYLVTHLVKPGVARPKGWTLQPWKRGDGREVDEEMLKGAVFASAVAKYVVKEGRKTIAPEQVLVDAEMVPVKPEGWVYKGDVEMKGEANGSLDKEGLLPKMFGEEEWNWDVIERERLRGLKLAESFAALDGLHEVFDGGERGALGRYHDL
ncbi:hypothetical protein M011DRAFT_479859 [Sporormia fimetaria CBS 119925]|uniref:Capsule polysaccharide biosynthesis protein n=1 Tax=Sporormia fimetaria CBS 119925 TaxID=1340428 RepID=A0A6A6V428_9PLEO|nr:hypothetical protein M011DRAFT_479859 [Sporormia fimetaria CBS 119925]